MATRNVMIVGCLLIVAAMSSCDDDPQHVLFAPSKQPDPVLPATPYDYYGGGANNVNNKIATLGRVLFYDKRLSANNAIACASCHKQFSGFADDQRYSIGFSGKVTVRNSMPIQNLLQQSLLSDEGHNVVVTVPNGYGSVSSTVHLGGLFWDGRESELRKMVLMPLAK